MKFLDYITGSNQGTRTTAIASIQSQTLDYPVAEEQTTPFTNRAEFGYVANNNQLPMQFTRDSFTHNVPEQLCAGYLTGKAIVLQVGQQLQVYKGHNIAHIKAIQENVQSGSVLVQFTDQTYLILSYLTNFQAVADRLTHMMINL